MRTQCIMIPFYCTIMCYQCNNRLDCLCLFPAIDVEAIAQGAHKSILATEGMAFKYSPNNWENVWWEVIMLNIMGFHYRVPSQQGEIKSKGQCIPLLNAPMYDISTKIGVPQYLCVMETQQSFYDGCTIIYRSTASLKISISLPVFQRINKWYCTVMHENGGISKHE